MKKEIWKDVVGYEGLYEVSSYGRIKSLKRLINNGKKEYFKAEIIMKQNKDVNGYFYLNLYLNGKSNKYRVHQLVAMAFLNNRPDGTNKVVVDHINNIKTDNILENLQLITHRENVSKDQKNKSSKYTGVRFVKNRGNWRASITINKKQIELGSFKTELQAHKAYQNKLKTLK